MAAYVIVEIDITDPGIYAEYVRAVPETVAAYGGRFLVRGGACETLEGDWSPPRLVVLEFDSPERAREWWASQEYAAPKAIRQSAANSRLIIATGVD